MTELLDGGSVFDLLHPNYAEEVLETPLPLPHVVTLLLGCALGMAFLHSRSIAHRDLKSANLLMATDGTAKVRARRGWWAVVGGYYAGVQ